jgi:hypothetical protein
VAGEEYGCRVGTTGPEATEEGSLLSVAGVIGLSNRGSSAACVTLSECEGAELMRAGLSSDVPLAGGATGTDAGGSDLICFAPDATDMCDADSTGGRGW